MIALVVAAIVVVSAAVLCVQGWRAYTSLRQVRADVAALQHDMAVGDLPAARRAAQSFSVHARSARRASDGWLWSVATRAPLLGPNLEAVRVMSGTLDDLAGEPLHDGLVLLSWVQDGKFVPHDARFDLSDYRRAAPLAARMSRATEAAHARLGAVHPSALVGPLGSAASRVQAQVATANDAARASRTALTLVPAMLGGSEPRSILVVVQNNAEIRATGGMPGSFSLLTARHGRLEMGPHYSTSDLPPLARPVAPLTPDERRLFGATPATDVRDTNLMPDFPRAAQLLAAIVGREVGTSIDSVVSVDPVALARVLRSTGPVKVGGETFKAQNVVASLLHAPYQRFATQAEQNKYFAEAARAITTSMLGGAGDSRDLVRQLTGAVGQRRVAVWSRRPAEQRQLAASAVADALGGGPGGSPHVGMYLNDAAGGKLEFYLRTTGAIRSTSCTGSRQSLRTTFEMTSKVPPGARGLSHWVTGTGDRSRRGIMQLNLRIYAPLGGRLTTLDVDGRRAAVTQGRHHDRQVSILPVELAPGAHTKVTATFVASAKQQDGPVLDWTPSVLWGAPTATAPSSC